MKASELIERNEHISVQSANVDRKNLCKYLKSLKNTALDIFWGNHSIDELDKVFLEEEDHIKAFNAACAILAYKELNIYGASSEIEDKDLFEPINLKDYNDVNSYYCCQLAKEYGRQLHYIIALKAQEEIENDLKDN